MGLTKRAPRATKPASYYAELTGLSSKTVKRKLREAGLQEIRYSDSPTAEVFFFQREADQYFAKRQVGPD